MAPAGVDPKEAPSEGARSRPTRTLRRSLSGVAILTPAIWILVLLVWRDGVFGFTFDDAFYYFGIARNIAGGHGSTFDQINTTNGYHPLWLAGSIVPYTLGLDDLAAARALLIFQLLFGWGATLGIVAALISRGADGWAALEVGTAPCSAALRRGATATLTIVFFLVVANPFIVKAFVNGLESGIAVTLYAILLFVSAGKAGRFVDRTLRGRLAIGALLALIFLARTDSILLLGCLGLWCAGQSLSNRGKDRSVGSSLGALIGLFAIPAITMTVYFALNRSAFGTAFQVSGLVKRAPLNASTIVPFVGFVAVGSLIGRHTFRRARGRKASRPTRFPHTSMFVIETGWFASFCVIVLGYYSFLQTQQWLWYYCPLVLYLIVVMMLAVTDIIEIATGPTRQINGGATAAAPSPTRSAARTIAPVFAILVIPLAIGFVLGTQSFTDPALLAIQASNRDAGEWMRDHLGDDAVVASWDAGAAGYFSHRRVVNIDGVVNSLAYYSSMGAGTYTAFLRCERVGYVVNHGPDVDGRDPEIDGFIRDLYGAEAARNSRVIERVPFTYSGTTSNGGFAISGPHELAVHVYEIPVAARGPRPTDHCAALG